MQVLQYQCKENGPTLRESLSRIHGTPVEEIMKPSPVESTRFVMFKPYIGLYRYKSPQNEAYVYLIELEHFAPVDEQWYESWVVDEEPTMDQMIEIANRELGVGDSL